MKKLLIAAALVAAAPATATATATTTANPYNAAIGEEARIALPGNRTIRTFRADSRDTLYIQDRGRRWYRASVLSYCPDLPYALAIGLDRRGAGSLDRFSTLIVDGQRCQLNSFVRVAGPPVRSRRR